MKTPMEQFCEDCPYYEPDIDADAVNLDALPCQNEHICKRVCDVMEAYNDGK